MNENAKYWLATAEDDLLTADAMFEKQRFLWMGFVCHLVIEKAFKAVISAQEIIPPKVHTLGKLAQIGGVFDKLNEEQLQIMATLDTMQIEARYPEYKQAIAKNMTASKSEKLLSATKDLLLWIKKLL